MLPEAVHNLLLEARRVPSVGEFASGRSGEKAMYKVGGSAKVQEFVQSLDFVQHGHLIGRPRLQATYLRWKTPEAGP